MESDDGTSRLEFENEEQQAEFVSKFLTLVGCVERNKRCCLALTCAQPPTHSHVSVAPLPQQVRHRHTNVLKSSLPWHPGLAAAETNDSARSSS